MKILALDVGQKRIGVATCDRLEIAATPQSVVKAGRNAVDEVVKIIKDEEVEFYVEGKWKINKEIECDSRGIENKEGGSKHC